MKRSLLAILLAFASVTFVSGQADSTLRKDLLAMRDVDQGARDECAKGNADEQIRCLVKTLETVDKLHTKRINEIFAKKGFPNVSQVGADGVKAYILLLQHSGDLALKKKCESGIKKAFDEKVVSPSEYANFVDRLLVDQKKAQIYGSNFESKDGKLVMSTVEDLPNLDARRKTIGLPPIAEYVKMLKEIYKLEVVN